MSDRPRTEARHGVNGNAGDLSTEQPEQMFVIQPGTILTITVPVGAVGGNPGLGGEGTQSSRDGNNGAVGADGADGIIRIRTEKVSA